MILPGRFIPIPYNAAMNYLVWQQWKFYEKVKPACTAERDEPAVMVFDRDAADALEEEVLILQRRLSKLQNLSSQPRITLSDPSWTPEGWWKTDEPPPPLRRFLFETFMPYTSTLAVFLNPERLKQAFHRLAPFDDLSRPSPALISAICLWGIVISGSPALTNHENVFFSRAVYHANNPGEFSSPQLAKYTIQAKLLIVHYCCRMGLSAEGEKHCDAAFKLALKEGLHKIRGADIPGLTSFTDAIELGENMNAIWMTFLSDTCLRCTHGLPVAFPDLDDNHDRIDMPWPLDMAQYEKGLMPPKSIEGRTLTSFMYNPVASYADEEVSFLAMECKAATLLKWAIAFKATWDPASDFADPNIYAELIYLNQSIDRFLETVSPVVAYDENKIRRFQLILVHCLTYLAAISLNVSPSWTYKSVDAATKLVHLFDNIELHEIRFLHSIIGKFWGISGQVLVAEYTRVKASPENAATLQSLEKLTGSLNRLEYLLKYFSDRCPSTTAKYQLFKSQRKQLEDADSGSSGSS